MDDKFSDVSMQNSMTGVPLLSDALKTLECELIEDSGYQDDSCFVGRIVHFQQSDQADAPLLLVHIDG